MEVCKYREALYKIKLWASRNNTNRVRLILDALNSDERNFRALQTINNIVRTKDANSLKRFFSIATPDYIEKARERYPKAYSPWGPEDDRMLKDYYEKIGHADLRADKCESIEDLARILQRSLRAVCERVVKHLGIAQCFNCKQKIVNAEPYKINSLGELVHFRCYDKDGDEDGAEILSACPYCKEVSAEEYDEYFYCKEDEEDADSICENCREEATKEIDVSIVMMCEDCGKEYSVSCDVNGEPGYREDDGSPSIEDSCPVCGGRMIGMDLDIAD